MPHSPIAAVMVHVPNVQEALRWYERAFPEARREVGPGTDFQFLRVGGLQLELVPADTKVSSGAAGSVVYWRVADLRQAIDRFRSLGAEVFRGPMPLEVGMGMCQVRDPWGNCIGLRGCYGDGPSNENAQQPVNRANVWRLAAPGGRDPSRKVRVILGSIEVTPISIADVESFHACLDAVAREQRYLALMEAPPLRELESFVAQNMAHQVPQVVAKDGNVVVGWCDISPGSHQTLQHCGTLGMGVLGGYRGRGIGRRLLRACVGLAKDGGMTRVELEVRPTTWPRLPCIRASALNTKERRSAACG